MRNFSFSAAAAILLLFPIFSDKAYAQADVCKVTRNYFYGDGGSSVANSVKGSDGGKTIVMETDFETITLKLGSIPATTGEFVMINYTETPSENQISVKIYSPHGNEVDTYDYNDSKTAFVCNDGNGNLTIAWKGVIFKQTANARIDVKTSLEVTCSGYAITATSTSTDSNDGGGTTLGNTTNDNSTNTLTVTGPDAELKEEIASYESQLTELTKLITTKEYELNEKISENKIDSIDIVIARYDISILSLKKDETRHALERTQKASDKVLSIDEKQAFISKEEQCRLKARSLETERNQLADTKATNVAAKKAIVDLNASITRLSNEIITSTPANKIDSLNVKMKEIELERDKIELERNKSVVERTDKSLKGTLTDKASREYAANEKNYQLRITDCNNRIAEQETLIKEEKKRVKKDVNKLKREVIKVKVQLKTVDREVKRKQKDVDKYKRKNDAEKLSVAEEELDEAKKKQSDLQKELDELNALIAKK